jgi:GDP-L-fucose synthase
MRDFSGAEVLVAGGTGLIGIPLVELLVQEGAHVHIVSRDDSSRVPSHVALTWHNLDLLDYKNCVTACRGMDYVFNLLCVKGSPTWMRDNPETAFRYNLLLDVNVLAAAAECGVGGVLLASSLAVYPPAEVFYEDDMWKGNPSPNDWSGGWAKRMGEVHAEACRKQYGIKVSIVRPANTYGPWDDFWSPAAMVVPSLIRQAVENRMIETKGDGSAVRDFIHARDVARGMMLAAKAGIEQPVNLGSGAGVSIRDLVGVIAAHAALQSEVVWGAKPSPGDSIRILDTARARELLGFEPQISLEEGVRDTIEWYIQHGDEYRGTRYMVS